VISVVGSIPIDGEARVTIGVHHNVAPICYYSIAERVCPGNVFMRQIQFSSNTLGGTEGVLFRGK
jgi:hypothetical protein